jgi:predicted dehydrogenase
VEKPLAITAEGCECFLQAARTGGARLYVGHSMRHMPVVRVMRDLIKRVLVAEFLRFVRSGGPTDTVRSLPARSSPPASRRPRHYADGRPVAVPRVAADLPDWCASGQS